MSPLRCSYLNGRTLHFQRRQDRSRRLPASLDPLLSIATRSSGSLISIAVRMTLSPSPSAGDHLLQVPARLPTEFPADLFMAGQKPGWVACTTRGFHTGNLPTRYSFCAARHFAHCVAAVASQVIDFTP